MNLKAAVAIGLVAMVIVTGQTTALAERGVGSRSAQIRVEKSGDSVLKLVGRESGCRIDLVVHDKSELVYSSECNKPLSDQVPLLQSLILRAKEILGSNGRKPRFESLVTNIRFHPEIETDMIIKTVTSSEWRRHLTDRTLNSRLLPDGVLLEKLTENHFYSEFKDVFGPVGYRIQARRVEQVRTQTAKDRPDARKLIAAGVPEYLGVPYGYRVHFNLRKLRGS